MGIIWEIIKGINDGLSDDDKNKKDDAKEKEMDSYALEDWQKDRVRKGLNDPWDFEEDDIEEGDYYDEDDE